MVLLIGGTAYDQNPYPTLPEGESMLAPTYEPGSNMSGGASFGGGATGWIGTQTPGYTPYHGGGTTGMSVGGAPPPLMTVATPPPQYAPQPVVDNNTNNFAAPQPMDFAQAPPQAGAPAPTPASNIPVPSPLQSLPSPTSPGGMAGGNTAGNPYANPSYSAPSNPLAFATVGAQAQGAPTALAQGQAPEISSGGGAPLSAGVPGAAGGHGITGNQPPMQATAPPPVPFGSIGSRLAATAGPANTGAQGNLQAGAATRGQAMQVPPPPPTPRLVLPPLATVPQAGQLGPITPGAAQQMQPQQAQSPIGAMLDKILGDAYDDQVKLQMATEKAHAQLDTAIAKIQNRITAPARAQVEVFTKPTLNMATGKMDGPSALEQGFGLQVQANAASAQASNYLGKANEAYNHIVDLNNGSHDDYFRQQGTAVKAVADKANKPAREIPGYIQNIRQAQNELIPASIYTGLKTQAVQRYEGYMKLQNDQAKELDAHAQALQGRADAINKQYVEALGEKVKAFDRAATIGKDMRDAFWKEYDEKVKAHAQLPADQMKAVEIQKAIMMAEDNNEFRKDDITLKRKANEIAEGKANNDVKDKQARQLKDIVALKEKALMDAKAKKMGPEVMYKLQAEYDAWSEVLNKGGAK